MTLGAFPSAQFFDSDFIILHVHSELLVSTEVILQSVVNVFIITAACEVNFGLVVALDAPAHREGWLRQLNQPGVLVHQDWLMSATFRHTTHRVGFDVSVAILALQVHPTTTCCWWLKYTWSGRLCTLFHRMGSPFVRVLRRSVSVVPLPVHVRPRCRGRSRWHRKFFAISVSP